MSIFSELITAGRDSRTMGGDPYAKGDVFERLVAGMFTPEEFICQQTTPRRYDENGRKVEEAEDLDFRFRHRDTGHSFWIECRFRGVALHERIQWCQQWQLERYRVLQQIIRPEKIFIVIGLGGWAKTPTHMYCLPLHDAENASLHLSWLKLFEHDQRMSFRYTNGRLR
jgi:hypothetical protein